MTLLDTLQLEIDEVLGITWQINNAEVKPEIEETRLVNRAFKINGTFLYADLADVPAMTERCSWETTAKIIRAYTNISVRLIQAHGGAISSGGSHRILGIFKGETPNTSAVNCARKIDWMVEKVLNPKADMAFPSIRNNKLVIRHSIGIDTSDAWAVRSGSGNSSELIWIGRAPEFAAHLCGISKYPFSVYISRDCFAKLGDISIEVDKANIWFRKNIKFGDETHSVYRTNGMLRP
ncbi:MAG: hypothetical protein ABI297_05830 [Ginsengibacter sp.]